MKQKIKYFLHFLLLSFFLSLGLMDYPSIRAHNLRPSARIP